MKLHKTTLVVLDFCHLFLRTFHIFLLIVYKWYVGIREQGKEEVTVFDKNMVTVLSNQFGILHEEIYSDEK